MCPFFSRSREAVIKSKQKVLSQFCCLFSNFSVYKVQAQENYLAWAWQQIKAQQEFWRYKRSIYTDTDTDTDRWKSFKQNERKKDMK